MVAEDEDVDGDSDAAANRGLLRMGCCGALYMKFFNCKRPSNVAGVGASTLLPAFGISAFVSIAERLIEFTR